MSLLDRILGRSVFTAPPGQVVEFDPGAGVSVLDMLRMPSSTDSSVRVTEHSSLGMAAVWRAVNLIASGCASLPLHAYKQVPVDGQAMPVRQLQTLGQAASFLAAPHPDLTGFELLEIIFTHMALWGNSYCLKVSDAGSVTQLWPIQPSRIKVGRASDLSKVYQLDGDAGMPLTDNEILHIPGFGYDGVAGLPPIALARQGIGLALAAEKFGSRLFGSGSLMSGLLTTEQRLNQEQANTLKQRWQAKVGGVDKSHEIAVLDSGAKFQQLTIPPEDAQFIESRGFQIEEVARIFGVPPHLLMAVDKTSSWGTGVEQQTLAFVTYTLRPWLTRVEQRLSRVLTPNNVYARFSLEGLLRGDAASRASYYQAMFGIGALSTNEIRALEEMAPVPGGASYYRPLNYGELGTFDTGSSPSKPPAHTDPQ